MRLVALVEASARVGATRARREKTAHLAAVIRALPAPLVALGVSYLAGDLPQGKVGVGHAALRGARGTADAPTLSLEEVDAVFTSVKAAAGAGSPQRRAALLGGLLARATAAESDFLVRLVLGELRQGALESLVAGALAVAFEAPEDAVRRAVMLAGAAPPVAAALAAEGAAGLARFSLELFRPVQPMLADSAPDAEGALERLGMAAFEHKLDGARVQVHKDGDHVVVYSRALNVVTGAVPELVARVAAMPARRLVLDGEAIALGPDGRPLPFQITMRRFGRKVQSERLRAELPLSSFFFDALRVDDDVLIDRPLSTRIEALAAASAGEGVVPRLVTDDPIAAEAFATRAQDGGHEGVMAKAPASLYAAGRRGAEWLKIKPAHTLDLVVLAAEWGSGRRQGWLSNLHLGARDPERGGFVMLGKTFKGMTDETLRWQTEALQARALGESDGGYVVHVRPELVVEVAFNDVQVSPHYPGGVALRFARLKRHRPDKRAEDASTLAEVRALLPRASQAS